jgi:hypothetical protein
MFAADWIEQDAKEQSAAFVSGTLKKRIYKPPVRTSSSPRPSGKPGNAQGEIE